MTDKTDDKHCVLLICRDKAAFRSVLSEKEIDCNDLIIASDDYSVHQLVKEHANLKIVYYHQMESMFTVAPYVLQILDSVNQWLSALEVERNLMSDLLYWVQHVEGGDTTQRILDAVLEARSCLAVFDKFQPAALIIGVASKYYWEDEVLIACAKHRNIPIKKMKGFNIFRTFRWLGQRLRPIAKEVYRSLVTIDSFFRSKFSGYGTTGLGEYVAIQCCSSAEKHLNHTLPLVKAFERAGMKAVVVTWEVGRAANTLRKQGYTIAELESYIPPNVIFRSWYAANKIRRRAKTNIANFLFTSEGGEYAPLVRSVLLSSMRSFFICELPQRIRLNAACRVFFKRNPPVAARLWTRILTQGVLAYRALKAVVEKLPLLFWQPGWPYQLQWPYHHYDIPVDLIFCISNAHQDLLKSSKHFGIQIAVSGINWFSRIKHFSSRNTPNQSRTSLGIDLKAKLVVFCDAQVVLGGYLTSYEQWSLINTVIEFAERYDDVCVLIKPHTGHKPGQLEEIFGERGNGRVIWIAGKSSPYNGLNAANVVLTKFSTLVAEAMCLGVPSVCVLLDRDMRWAIYEDAVDYAWTIQELMEKLEALRDMQYYESWANAMRERQSGYMARHLPTPTVESNEFIASKVKAIITGVEIAD